MSDQDEQLQQDVDGEEWGPVEASEGDGIVGVKVMSTRRPGVVSGGS